MTSQVSWRADEELIERARRRARELNTSLNGFVTQVVDAATNPDTASTEGQRLRERLEAAGLLAHFPPPEGPSPSPDERKRVWAQVAESERHGSTLAELIDEGRGR